jgi:ATP phosphoribosyltransferase
MFANDAAAPGLVGQIQKPGGHLSGASLEVLRRAGYRTTVLANVSESRQEWTGPDGQKTKVVTGRVGDAIDNVRDGYADWAIVSSDAMERCRAANREVTGRRGDVQVAIPDLGLAGSCLMLMAPKENQDEDWEKLVRENRIVTSDKSALQKFLGQRNVRAGGIIERQGGTEPLARTLVERDGSPVLIFDLAATGRSAFDNGFVPKVEGEESRIVLIRNAAGKAPEQLDAFCKAVETARDSIRDAVAEMYVRKLEETHRQKGPNTPGGQFAARRAASIRSSGQCTI